MGMQFKDKIMLHCFGEVKYKQGFTTGIWYYLYDALGLTINMCFSGLMVSESELRYSDSGLFPGGKGTNLLFNFFEDSNE